MGSHESPEKRHREKDEMRRTILDAARELFVTDGCDAVTLRKIADKIAYSPTTIYLHFRDKDEILSALIEEGFQKLALCLESNHDADAIARLRQHAHCYLSFAREQPHYYAIMFEIKSVTCLQHASAISATKVNAAGVAWQKAFDFLLHGVEEGIAQGQIPPAPSALIQAHTVWASIHGAASLLLAGRLALLSDQDLPGFLDNVVENALRGVRTPATP